LRVSFRQNLLPEEGRFAVKRKRFSVEQIVAVLKQAEFGVPVTELIRQVGITDRKAEPKRLAENPNGAINQSVRGLVD
jgi:hypothetical protein